MKRNHTILINYVVGYTLKTLFSVCGGGVWFDQSQGGKETVENVQMVQLSAKLARNYQFAFH